jgi:hypothetical protein
VKIQMDQLNMLEIGEIRYIVFVDDADSNPWVCRLRLDSLSPKGRRTRWKPLNSSDDTPISYGHDCLPFPSAIEAIEDFQQSNAYDPIFVKDRIGRAERVRRILYAEKIKERLVAKANTIPIHAVASTG